EEPGNLCLVPPLPEARPCVLRCRKPTDTGQERLTQAAENLHIDNRCSGRVRGVLLTRAAPSGALRGNGRSERPRAVANSSWYRGNGSVPVWMAEVSG